MDEKILNWGMKLIGKGKIIDFLIAFFADWPILLLPISLIALWFWPSEDKYFHKKNASLSFFAAATGFILDCLIGVFYFRPRPFVSFKIPLLISHIPDKSFPADHATLGLSIGLSFYLLGYKKLSYLILFFTFLFSFLRIVVGLHYFTDVLGSLFVGVLAVFLVFRFRRFFEKYLIPPLISLAKKLRLA